MNSAGARIERANAAFDDVLHVHKIPLLLTVLKDARSLPRLYLARQMINHTGGHAFVSLARSINVEVTQAYDDPIRQLGGSAPGDIVHNHLGKSVNVCWRSVS